MEKGIVHPSESMLTVEKTRELKEQVGKVRSWKHTEL